MKTKARSLVDEAMRQLYFKRWRECCIVLDRDLKVLELSGDLSRYGLQDLAPGDDAAERMDFAVGLTLGVSMGLPLVAMDNGELAEVHIDTWEDCIVIVLYVATGEHNHYFELQRRTSEVRMLIERQKRLVRSLVQTRAALRSRSAELESLNELKSRFIARMSHEFRTPLTSILGYTPLLDRYVQSDPDGVAHLASVGRAAKHLLAMIESILDQARMEAGELSIDLRPADLRSLFDEIGDMFMPISLERGLAFSVSGVESIPPRVEADAMRLRQVMLNLVGNAVKYTPEGRVEVTVEWKEAWLTVRVRDTGPGIPISERERIFTPFQRLPATESAVGGTGLGLAISRSLVELMGGVLALEEDQGSGAVFLLTLPAPVDVSDAAREVDPVIGLPTPVSLPPVIRSGVRILIAEDDEDIARLMCVVLAEAGFEPLRVADGAAAVRTVCDESVDLVLMDMNMPVLDGEGAVQQIREGGYEGPVIGLSASVAAADRERAMRAGCDDYVAKPVDLPALVRVLARWLDHPDSMTEDLDSATQAWSHTKED